MTKTTLHDIISWIIDNSDDEQAMTKIAVTAYPFSSRFKQRYPDREVSITRDDEDFPSGVDR